MNREKYPEKVPFRLTRMLIKAMEVSGIEGSYRSTCEDTMSVLRSSRDSLVAMLEAFVYDPLISWRLVDLSPGRPSDNSGNKVLEATTSASTSPILSNRNDDGVLIELGGGGRSNSVAPIFEDPEDDQDDADDATGTSNLDVGGMGPPGTGMVGHFRARSSSNATDRARSLQMYTNIQSMAANLSTESRIASITGEGGAEVAAAEGSMARSRVERSMRQRELMSLLEGDEGAAHEVALNEKALKVIRRVQTKLAGTDNSIDNSDVVDDVSDQVQRLIVQATSSENLCQLFVGWCSFW
jgi:phosphatidylinositol kinase/protein kinase (PI-3  family)